MYGNYKQKYSAASIQCVYKSRHQQAHNREITAMYANAMDFGKTVDKLIKEEVGQLW